MEVNKIFEASAVNVEDILGESAINGYRIPNYQRTYDWTPANVDRLFSDCLSGLYRLSQQTETEGVAGLYTFIGTVIVVEEKTGSEQTFSGKSFLVVDGQQRLTTLSLICLAVLEKLQMISLTGLSSLSLSEESEAWLSTEVDDYVGYMHTSICGQLKVRGNIVFPFPRIVRDGDVRAKNASDSIYRSPISKLLYEVNGYLDGGYATTYQPSIIQEQAGEYGESQRLISNFRHIKMLLEIVAEYDEEKANDRDLMLINPSDFSEAETQQLIYSLQKIEDDVVRGRIVEDIRTNPNLVAIVRTLLFSSYILNRVVLTRVIAPDEDNAFDIFDSLNTTGEPLTAIETLKPRVIRFEKTQEGYTGSPSEQYFNLLEENLNEVFPKTEDRQNETKQLLVSFHLYLLGQKVPLDLSSQRSYLQKAYEATPTDKKIDFIRSLSKMAEFRQIYWTDSGLRSIDLGNDELNEEVKLHFKFLRDNKTTMAIPVLCRYWVFAEEVNDYQLFLNALRSINAFVLIRRGFTGGTEGIDTDFRKLMSSNPENGQSPMCIGEGFENVLSTVEELKLELKRFLDRKGVVDKDSWVRITKENGLYRDSKPLCRFLLLAASHHSGLDPDNPGLLTRTNIRPNTGNAFLTYQSWITTEYRTVEHVAPVSSSEGWDDAIYSRNDIIHKLGNLTLLPQKENSAAGNRDWGQKKIFYDALNSAETSELEEILQRAKDAGFEFNKTTQKLLRDGARLRMLAAIQPVTIWNKELIDNRSENIATLSWDVIGEWLDY